MNIALKNKGLAIQKNFTLYKEDIEALDELQKKFGMKKSTMIQQLINDAYNKYIEADNKKC
jgi:hypothetical protein